MILPFTILRRLDCILEPTKDEVLAEYKKIASTKVDPGVLLKNNSLGVVTDVYRYSHLAEAGDPVQLSPLRTTNLGQGFQGFWRPTA